MRLRTYLLWSILKNYRPKKYEKIRLDSERSKLSTDSARDEGDTKFVCEMDDRKRAEERKRERAKKLYKRRQEVERPRWIEKNGKTNGRTAGIESGGKKTKRGDKVRTRGDWRASSRRFYDIPELALALYVRISSCPLSLSIFVRSPPRTRGKK